MEYSFKPEVWHQVFVILGSSSAGLIGLLFIAASLQVKAIASNPVFYRRAFNNSCFLLIILTQSLLVLIPQPIQILGAELVAINIVGLWLPIRFVYGFFKNEEVFRRGGGSIYLAIIFGVILLLGITGGVALIGHLNWGMYLVAASCFFLLVRVVLAAWSILAGVGELEKTSKTK